MAHPPTTQDGRTTVRQQIEDRNAIEYVRCAGREGGTVARPGCLRPRSRHGLRGRQTLAASIGEPSALGAPVIAEVVDIPATSKTPASSTRHRASQASTANPALGVAFPSSDDGGAASVALIVMEVTRPPEGRLDGGPARCRRTPLLTALDHVLVRRHTCGGRRGGAGQGRWLSNRSGQALSASNAAVPSRTVDLAIRTETGGDGLWYCSPSGRSQSVTTSRR